MQLRNALVSACLALSAFAAQSASADVPALEAAAQPTQCDQLAAIPLDPDLPKGFPAVRKVSEIDAGSAVSACRRAVAEAPQDRRAHFQLGRALQSAKQFPEAKREYDRAAADGAVAAMNALGALYFNGWGVEKDYAQARVWFQKAADRGFAVAQYNLSLVYENGLGVTKDYTLARTWLETAAAKGYPDAENNLGVFYARGWGGEQDFAKAREWLRKAVEQGVEAAQTNLNVIAKKITTV